VVLTENNLWLVHSYFDREELYSKFAKDTETTAVYNNRKPLYQTCLKYTWYDYKHKYSAVKYVYMYIASTSMYEWWLFVLQLCSSTEYYNTAK